MTIPFRPLAEVKMMLEETGNDISYAYDDLIFVEHTAFLIQFDDVKPADLKLFFNTEIKEDEVETIQSNLIPAAGKRQFNLINSGYFSLKEKEDSEELDILFFPKKQ